MEEKRNYGKLTLIILGLIGVFMLMGLLFTSGKLLTFLLLFPWVTGKIQETTGFNIWVARMISVMLSIAIMVVIPMAISRKQALRKRGLCVIAASIIVFCLGMFWMHHDYNFDRNGKAMRTVAMTPLGEYVEVPTGYTVHPVYGTPAEPITPDKALRMHVQEKGIPEVHSLTYSEDMQFFAGDGTPLVWYYEYPDGRIELFTHGGVHPRLNVVLSPINTNIANKLYLHKQQEKERLEEMDRHDLVKFGQGMSAGTKSLKNFYK